MLWVSKNDTKRMFVTIVRSKIIGIQILHNVILIGNTTLLSQFEFNTQSTRNE